MRLFIPILFCALALGACRKSTPTTSDAAPMVLAPVPDFVTNAPLIEGVSPYEPQGVVLARFDGELTDDDERQPEDNSRVDLHYIELKGGEWYSVVMWADQYDAFLMVRSPNEKQAHNDDCLDVHRTISCVTFEAPVDGNYEIRANAFDHNGKGKYVVYAYRVQPPAPAPEAADAEIPAAAQEDAPAVEADTAAQPLIEGAQVPAEGDAAAGPNAAATPTEDAAPQAPETP